MFHVLQVIDINVYDVNGRGFHSSGILRPSLYFLAMLGDTEFFDAKIGASSALHIVVLFYRWFIFHIIYLLIEGDNVFCISEKEFLCTKKYCRVFFQILHKKC